MDDNKDAPTREELERLRYEHEVERCYQQRAEELEAQARRVKPRDRNSAPSRERP